MGEQVPAWYTAVPPILMGLAAVLRELVKWRRRSRHASRYFGPERRKGPRDRRRHR